MVDPDQGALRQMERRGGVEPPCASSWVGHNRGLSYLPFALKTQPWLRSDATPTKTHAVTAFG
jgi:hypothetical protein